MFTGIVREVGRVEAVEERGESVRLVVRAPETAAAAAVAAASAAVAAAAVMATSATATRMASPTMTASMTAAAAVADKLHHRRCIVATFFVEDVERCQANV